MSKQFITRILNAHSIESETVGDRIVAVEKYTQDGIPGEDRIDLTDWSFDRLYDWLGYTAPGIW